MMLSVRLVVVAALWMLSFTLLVVRTVMWRWQSLGVLSTWSLWVGLVALAVTGAHVLHGFLLTERRHVQEIADLVAAACAEQGAATPKPVD